MLKGWVTILLVCVLAITGCTSNSEQTGRTNGGGGGLSKEQQSGDVQKVIVSRSQAFGQVNDAVYGTFTKADDINTFQEAFRTAEKMLGMLDVRKPDYDIVVEIKGSHHSVHLWLDSKSENGMYTEVTDTGTGYKLTTSASKRLKEMLAGLRYSPEQAAKNGDVVNMHGKWGNLDKWNLFLGNVKNGTKDDVHITSYTIEGDPIFQDLIFTGQTLEYTFDNTHDAYGNPVKTISFCSKIKDNKTNKGTEYTLAGCEDGRGDNANFSLLVQ